MAVTISGKLSDITGRPVEEITRATVKAETPTTIATGLVATQPRDVPISSDGSVTVTVEEGVKTWLYLEGRGWSDSVPLIAAAGMTFLWEAVANALGLPGDMQGFLDLKKKLQEMIDEAVAKAPSLIKWEKGAAPDDLPSVKQGFSEVVTAEQAKALGLPVASGGVLEKFNWGIGGANHNYRFTTFVDLKPQVWIGFGSGENTPVWTMQGTYMGRRVPDELSGSLENAPVGVVEIYGFDEAAKLKLPKAAGGLLETVMWGPSNYFQTYTVGNKATGEHEVWTTMYSKGETPVWDKVGAQIYRMTAAQIGTLENAPVGVVELWGKDDAQALGLPVAKGGLLETVKWGASNFFQTYKVSSASGGQEEWSTAYAKGQKPVWKKTSTDAAGAANVSPSGLKTVPLALTLGTSSAQNRPAKGSCRLKIQYNAPIQRFRVCMSNRNPISGKSTGATVTVSKVTIGGHVGGGKFTGAPKQIAANLSIPADGAPAYGPWQTYQIDPMAEMLLGYDYAASGEVSGLLGSSWKTATGTSTTIAPDDLSTDWLAPLDIWLEVETLSTTPVIAVMGDSLSSGVGATWSVFDSWLSQYCRRVGALPVHYSASGDNARSWAGDFNSYKWTRWDGTTAPDTLIWALGSNDFGGSVPLTETQDNTLKIIEQVRKKWNPSLYTTTITPRQNRFTDQDETNRRTYNAWLKQRTWARAVFDFDAAINDGANGIKAEYNSDDVHLKTIGYTVEAELIPANIVTQFNWAKMKELGIITH